MVKVYFFHSGWLPALDPLGLLSGAAACDVEEQATSVPPRASRPVATRMREGLPGMGIHVLSVLWWEKWSVRVGMASVRIGQPEVFQERGTQLFSGDTRLTVRGRQLDEVGGADASLAHHDDAVGQRDRLVHVVGDKQHGRVVPAA